ncbi:MAG: NADH-quinone oxidoreductase subunit M [Bacteroidetes bacterium]|nr:NADH-quinone oxidoreductase subunit M [Bacteroidota bacterium]
MNFLELLIITNILCLGFLFTTKDVIIQKLIGLYGSFLLFGESLLLWVNFDNQSAGYQMESIITLSDNLNVVYHIGIDGLSIFFVILSVFLLPVCILCSWATIHYRVREFYVLLFLITFLLIQVFTVIDLFLFYVFFESVLIPMFLIIGIWGSRERKIHAAYQFFLYTLIGSLLMLLGVIYIYVVLGSTHCYVLLNNDFSVIESRLLWLAFFASFAVKVPMVPVHIWLPEAHVEAPTAGSVLLAGILLKMGTYGLLRFSLPMFPEATVYFQPLVYVISLISIIYSACTTIRQIDLKKIIAYSSVGHMNFVTLGILSNNLYGIEGSIFLMLSHGLVSSALFLCVGLLYERYHTRVLLYYGGLVYGMPLFAIFFLLFTLANVSLPGTSSFVGEFLVLVGVYQTSFFTTFIATVGVILGAVYAMWLYNRVMFGSVKIDYLTKFSDLNLKEVYLLGVLLLGVLSLGIYPSIILESLHSTIYLIFEKQC